MRCGSRSDFVITYRFGHNSSNFGPILFKLGSKCADSLGVSRGQPVAFKTGCNRFIGPVFLILQSTQPQPAVRSSSVFGLFSVAWTGPLNTSTAPVHIEHRTRRAGLLYTSNT